MGDVKRLHIDLDPSGRNSAQMTTYPQTAPVPVQQQGRWFNQAEAWLDSKGIGAWIAVMVLGFVLIWPIGLIILAYMIWSKRMFSNSCRNRNYRSHAHSSRSAVSAMRPTGNSAFNAYKADTLSRLENEQQDFERFLERLREAKDKSEFDQFMDERVRQNDADNGAE